MKKKIFMVVLFLVMLFPIGVLADDTADINAYFNEITTSGETEKRDIAVDFVEDIIDSSKPGYIYEKLYCYGLNRYNTDEFTVSYIPAMAAMGDIPARDAHIMIMKGSTTKEFDVNFKYSTSNSAIFDRVAEYQEQIPDADPEHPDATWFKMEDMELINYIYHGGFTSNPAFDEIADEVLKYSKQIKSILSNSNILTFFSPGMGYDSPFASGLGGDLELIYKGIAYGHVSQTGVSANHIMYVPTDTEKTTSAFIAAAKKRIKEYLGKDIEINVGEKKASELTIEELDYKEISEFYDTSKSVDNYFVFTINDEDINFFIVADSTQMSTGELKTVDFDSGSIITTGSSDVTLDSKIIYSQLDKNSTDYKSLLAKLKLKDGISADIRLHSDGKNSDIKKLTNGEFVVYIPITEDMKGKDLTAYFIDENGKIERYDAPIEGNYAIFKTKHFSTYTLGLSDGVSNPNTGDNIMSSIGLGALSLIGLIGCGLFFNKKRLSKGL